MKKLFILRPEPSATATRERAEAAGLDAVVIPLFEVGPIAWQAPDPGDYGALLLTSANAIRHGGDELQKLTGLPAYCVGTATAAAAHDAGFAVAGVGPSDGEAALLEVPEGVRVLHIAGADHRAVAKSVVPVYRSTAIDPPPALAALAGGVAMIHSPRAGQRLAELVDDRATIAIAAISPAAAAAVGTGWRTVAVAPTPDDLALLAVAADLCHNRDR